MTDERAATLDANENPQLVAAVLDLLDAQDRGEAVDWEAWIASFDSAVQKELQDVLAGFDLLQFRRSPPPRRRSRDLPPTLPDFDRYAELRYRAQGGMKSIYGATDTVLGRRVALAIMHPDLAREPRAVEWFLEEARVASQLQHPNIAPVYDMGHIPGDPVRPYFSMKLILGRTLADVIAEYRRSPTDVMRESLLQSMVAVCGALEYAHRQGVFHRDLKPVNVMVGQHGEVQVMDWGLSKRQSPHDAETPASLAGAGTASDTMSGTLHEHVSNTARGTPAYMAPEQAQAVHVGAASDVFALGATLCELLTGAPPYRGDSVLEILRKAKETDLSDAWQRLSQCAEPPELIELTRHCLAAEAGQRPPSAEAVGKAITSFMAERQHKLRELELAKAGAEARVAEERKRRRLQFTYGSVLLLAMAAATVAWQSVRAANERRTQTAMRTISAALDKARASHREAQEAPHETSLECERAVTAWKAALAAAEQASSQVTIAKIDEATIARVAQMQNECVTGLEAAAARLAQSLRFEKLISDLERVYASTGTRDILGTSASEDVQEGKSAFKAAFGAADLDLAGHDVATGASRLRTMPSAQRERLIEYIDLWAMSESELEQHLHAIAGQIDENPLRVRMRQAMHDRDFAALEKMAAELLQRREQLPLVQFMAMFLFTDGRREPAVSLLKQARTAAPHDFWTHLALGKAFADMEVPRDREAIACYRCAIALQPDSSYSYSCLGTSLWNLGEWDEAEQCYHQALRLDPKNLQALVSLAELNIFYRGDLPAARKAAEQALAISPDHAIVHLALSVCALYEGKTRAASKELQDIYRRYGKSPVGMASGALAALFDGRTAAAVKLAAQARSEMASDASNESAFVDLLYLAAALFHGDTLQAIDVARSCLGRYEEGSVYEYYMKLFLSVALACGANEREAESLCRQAMALRPDDPLPLHFLLWMLMLRWDLPAMEIVYEQYHPMAVRHGGLHRLWDVSWKVKLAMMRSSDEQLRKINAGELDRNSQLAVRFAAAHIQLLAEGELSRKNGPQAWRFYDAYVQNMPEFLASWSGVSTEAIGLSNRMNAVRAAGCFLSAASEGALDADEVAAQRSEVRAKAREWFEFEVGRLTTNIRKNRWPGYARRAFNYCKLTPDLAPFREPFIEDMPEEERASWRKLWADVDAALAETKSSVP